jgi:hypothetical protein
VGKVNVKGGTAPDHSTDLCVTCRFGSNREGQGGETQVTCSIFGKIKQPTLRCSEYSHKNQVELIEMKEIAWVITPNNKQAPGFRPYKELSKEEQRAFVLPGEYD